jgi:DNA repair protein RadA/Sms
MPFVLTGVAGFERLVGGWLPKPSMTLVAGDPGVGKTILLLKIAQGACGQGCGPVLYVSAEESTEALCTHAERTGAMAENLHKIGYGATYPRPGMKYVQELVDKLRPSLVILDSVQTLAGFDEEPQAMHDVLVCARALHLSCSRQVAVVMAGHTMRDGQVESLPTLARMFDHVLTLRQDESDGLRHLTASGMEPSLFEMRADGLHNRRRKAATAPHAP